MDLEQEFREHVKRLMELGIPKWQASEMAGIELGLSTGDVIDMDENDPNHGQPVTEPERSPTDPK